MSAARVHERRLRTLRGKLARAERAARELEAEPDAWAHRLAADARRQAAELRRKLAAAER